MVFRRIAFALLALCVAASVARAAECTPQPIPPEGFSAAVNRNAAAVVQVVVLRGARDPMEDATGFEFFQPMQGLPLPGGEDVDRTFSSGFFIDADGVLLASAHAVFDAREIWVVAADGKHMRATVLGLDRRRDVAVLKVDASGMPVVDMAVKPQICAGAWVVAMGSPFGFDRTVTAGVVSTYPRYLHGSSIPLIQSDVVLNPGSSGGPLFDASGRLVGMSTMIFSATGIYVGMSFALPVHEVVRAAKALRGGTVHAGEIGARMQLLSAELARAFSLQGAAGALLIGVDDGSPAARAGLRAGDVVLGFAGGDRLAQDEIESRLAAAEPGTTLTLEVWRDGSPRQVRLEVAAARSGPIPPIRVTSPTETRLGLTLTVLRGKANVPPGLYVEGATGSALLSGLERGDRIIAVGALPVASIQDFDVALEAASHRDVVALLVARGSTVSYVPVMPGR